MKFLKAEKGTYGYIDRQRIIEIIKTVFMFACAIGLYFIGFVTLKTNKSIWTILAVLSVLPAAKSAVSMIMFIRFSSISKEEYTKIEGSRGNIPTNYEYVFTTSEKSYYIKAVSCCNNTVIALLDNKSKKDVSNEIKDHIISSINREGFKGYSLKIYTNINDYVLRLNEMNEKLLEDDNKSSNKLFALFNAITI